MVIVKKCKASWFCGPFFLPVIVSFFELLNWTQILQHINQPVLTLIAQATTSTVQAGPSHSAQLKRRVDIKQTIVIRDVLYVVYSDWTIYHSVGCYSSNAGNRWE